MSAQIIQFPRRRAYNWRPDLDELCESDDYEYAHVKQLGESGAICEVRTYTGARFRTWIAYAELRPIPKPDFRPSDTESA